MKTYKKELAFLLSATLFCVLCAAIIVVSLRTAEKPKIDLDTYDTILGNLSEITPETKVYEDIIGEPVTSGLPDGVSYRRITSKTVINTENGSRVVFNYPYFEGFSDEIDANLNSLVKYELDNRSRETGEGMYKLASYGAKVIYEVTDFKIGYADSKFISIMFEGIFDFDSEGEHIDTGEVYFRYSMNIGIDKMQLLTSKQLFSDYYTMRSRLLDGKLSLAYGQQELLSDTSYSSILSQYNDKYQIYPDLFFEDSSVNIIITLTADLGGCAVFSDSLIDGKEYLNTYLSELSEYLS